MARFGVFWLPWLTTAASGSCRLKSAAAIDAEDVPVAHHADESFRLRSASTYTLTSRLSSAAIKHAVHRNFSSSRRPRKSPQPSIRVHKIRENIISRIFNRVRENTKKGGCAWAEAFLVYVKSRLRSTTMLLPVIFIP